ncbi:hypothetical protein FACS189468_4970 [Spirochaetia bacterium]|nr:hypothetical protein FACS189468_4970 [Spirochaetia bacterium]
MVTWEALEHEGPGIYDEAYLAYLRKLLLMAEKQGIAVVMDPYQDAWSRRTGGDGAPAWTLEQLGMDLEGLDDPEAGFLRKRYAAAAMFTLFFAGNAYAPETRIDGVPAQDWLQKRYLEAYGHCRRRLKHCKAITGWRTMTEPQPGFIGCRDLEEWENYAAAAFSLFKEGFSCPWKQAGVWTDGDGKPRLLKKDHFALYNNRPACFADDFLKPFLEKFIQRMGPPGMPAELTVSG